MSAMEISAAATAMGIAMRSIGRISVLTRDIQEIAAPAGVERVRLEPHLHSTHDPARCANRQQFIEERSWVPGISEQITDAHQQVDAAAADGLVRQRLTQLDVEAAIEDRSDAV